MKFVSETEESTKSLQLLSAQAVELSGPFSEGIHSFFTPNPIDTSKVIPQLLNASHNFQVTLPPFLIEEVGERLAENIHEGWSKAKIDGGWQYGPLRNDFDKIHPLLVPYAELSDEEKAYDLDMALETLRVLKVRVQSLLCCCNT